MNQRRQHSKLAPRQRRIRGVTRRTTSRRYSRDRPRDTGLSRQTARRRSTSRLIKRSCRPMADTVLDCRVSVNSCDNRIDIDGCRGEGRLELLHVNGD